MKRVVAGHPAGLVPPADAQRKTLARKKRQAAPVPGAGATSINLSEPDFSDAVIAWQKQHGRHALPWQKTRDAYRIWLSEIMLQQTQVAAVIPYYQRFLQTFPDVQTLASASSEQVMSHWSGLGYYSRARNLHKCAQTVVAEYDGVFPHDPALLEQLPGIGRSTAAAIAAFSHGARAAILDGNVKRVFARVFGIDRYPGEKTVENALWQRAVALLPEQDIESYTQGLMDLGATLCTRSRPACARCPLALRCVAHATGRTAELPVRKPKKTVPERHAAMLVVVDGGQVLLQQRPDTGIWGGLLSLPQITIDSEMSGAETDDYLTREMARTLAPFGEIDAADSLPAIAHGFTHFRLHIAPYRVRLGRRYPLVAQPGHVWYALDALADAPLPAPVKKLLLHLVAAPFPQPDLPGL